MSDALIEALRDAELPSAEARVVVTSMHCDGEYDSDTCDRELIATDLPAIVRATLPHWSADLRREVLRELLQGRLDSDGVPGSLRICVGPDEAVNIVGLHPLAWGREANPDWFLRDPTGTELLDLFAPASDAEVIDNGH